MKELTLSSYDIQKIKAAADIILCNIKDHYKITELAKKVSINRNKLTHGFGKVFGKGPYTFRNAKRIELAKELLLKNVIIREVALSVGFTGSRAETNFVKFFKKEEKQSPAAWRTRQQMAAQ